MRTARSISFRNQLRGGKIKKQSNMQQLQADFAKQISFGKAPPPTSSEKIRKKFSI